MTTPGLRVGPQTPRATRWPCSRRQTWGSQDSRAPAWPQASSWRSSSLGEGTASCRPRGSTWSRDPACGMWGAPCPGEGWCWGTDTGAVTQLRGPRGHPHCRARQGRGRGLPADPRNPRLCPAPPLPSAGAGPKSHPAVGQPRWGPRRSPSERAAVCWGAEVPSLPQRTEAEGRAGPGSAQGLACLGQCARLPCASCEWASGQHRVSPGGSLGSACPGPVTPDPRQHGDIATPRSQGCLGLSEITRHQQCRPDHRNRWRPPSSWTCRVACEAEGPLDPG